MVTVPQDKDVAVANRATSNPTNSAYGTWARFSQRQGGNIDPAMCYKWWLCAYGGMREDTYELYLQCDKVSWIFPACKKLVRSATLGNSQKNQRQIMQRLDDTSSVELGDNGSTGLLKCAEGKGDLRLTREKRLWNRH